jgi:dienelactone hydrolase
MHRLAALLLAASALGPASRVTAAAPAVTGTVEFTPTDDRVTPERFRLAPHTFPFELVPKYDLPYSGVEVFDVRFPSPVASPHPENNTVHCEYFRPKGRAGIPAVIVLDILDGRQIVSRGEALWLAQHDVAALVVYMAYYGPRRPAGSRIRMMSPDIEHSVAAITQTVLDVRRAAAWLAARPEVDPDRLGLVGTSLGSLVGGVAAAAEPRLRTACLLLGGGGLVDAFYDHPKAASVRRVNELLGGSKAALKRLIDPVDPLTYADRLGNKKLLLIAASRDDVVPPAAMTRLWEATGRPKIVWYDATHVGAALYVFPAMATVVEHVKQK